MTPPDKQVREALENLMRTVDGRCIRGWIEDSLFDLRRIVESPGTQARDFHAGAAGQLAELLSHLPAPRW